MLKKKTFSLPFKSFSLVGILCFGIGFLTYPLLIHQEQPVAALTEQIQVCFTPTQSCLPKIIQAIDQAKNHINLLGYSFTSKPITQALIQAKQRGVNVRIVLDRSQRHQKSAQEVIQKLYRAQINLRFEHSVAIAHNKILIIDDTQVLTGSYNWSHAAEYKNAENLVFIRSKALAKRFKEYFDIRWDASRSYFYKGIRQKNEQKSRVILLHSAKKNVKVK